ncbi:SsgA family sporulation/cell division regulator [Streptomyces sp. NPDC056600]|uniref:SsgA family sporulation/cell division regulator n=1 Tax=Streptomyces sp. NPDC056600 TaxID=3345874 RepID=UPI0036C1ADE2
MSAIEQYTRAHVLTATQEDVGGRVPAMLRHEPGASEVTIRLAAPTPREWRVDRALLERGVCSPARGAEAEGGRVWPCGRAATVVELPGEQGVVVAQFDTTALLRFLGRIHAAATGAPTPAPTGATFPASTGPTPLAPAAAAAPAAAIASAAPATAAPASTAAPARAAGASTAAPAPAAQASTAAQASPACAAASATAPRATAPPATAPPAAGARAARKGARVTRSGGPAKATPVTTPPPSGVTVRGAGAAPTRPS